MITIDLSNDKKLDIIIAKLDKLKEKINELKKEKSHKILEDKDIFPPNNNDKYNNMINDFRSEFSHVIPKTPESIMKAFSKKTLINPTLEEINNKYFPDDISTDVKEDIKTSRRNMFDKIDTNLTDNMNNNIITTHNTDDIINEIKTSEEITINEKQH